DPFQQISQLRRRDRHRLVRIFLRNGQWPHKAASLQPLGEQTHALAIVPEHLDQSTTPAAEYEQVAIVRVALERLLHQRCQAIEALAHIGMAGCQPYPHSGRDRDHRGRTPLINAATAAASVAGSTAPVIRIRDPLANSTSIMPRPGGTAEPGPAATRTAANCGASCGRGQSYRTHPDIC